MRKLILFFSIVFFSTSIFAQLKLDENFNYTAGDSIGAHGWVWFSGVANTVFVTAPGLTYAGYPLSGIGNAATLTTNGNDQYKSLSSVSDTGNAQAIYAAFMVNVTSAQRPGDYIAAFLPSTSTSFFSGRVQIRLVAGVMEFGLTKASQPDTNTMVWATGYALSTTYLVVLKYRFVLGPNNDEVSLFVFSGAIPAVEPAATIGPMTFSTTSGDANNIGRIALRQGTTSRAPNSVVDGIRVATSWFPVVLNLNVAIQGLVVGTRTTRIDTMEVYCRDTTSPYTIVDSCTIPVNFINGVAGGVFSFANAPNGTYYIDARYRHLPIYRNGIQTWSKSGGESVSKFGVNQYDFTSAASQAYGSNQITLPGPVIALYNGDVNQDGIIDGSDASDIDNAAANFETGYLNVDLDGNDFVDGSDAAIADNNAFNFIGEVLPPL